MHTSRVQNPIQKPDGEINYTIKIYSLTLSRTIKNTLNLLEHVILANVIEDIQGKINS